MNSKTSSRYYNLALSKMNHVLEFMMKSEQLTYTTYTTPTENRTMKFVWEDRDKIKYKVHSKSTQKIIAEGSLQV